MGLNADQIRSLEPLCGSLRQADDLSRYLNSYNWTETDIVVARYGLMDSEHVARAHLLVLGHAAYRRDRPNRRGPFRRVDVAENTEREVAVTSDCPPQYSTLASELSRGLSREPHPPPVFTHSNLGDDDHKAQLIATTSGLSVAMRLVITHPVGPNTIDVLLPDVPNLSEWFRVFLDDIHSIDPSRVPNKPPRLMQPSDWYTPEERALAEKIAATTLEIERLADRRVQLEADLADAAVEADSGIRQILWADGDELVEAAKSVLADLGFMVCDMDALLAPGEQRREDLRLNHESDPEWEAIVEVKGYSRGTKTNDSRQIREHRDRYIAEEGRTPPVTLWLANPYREQDPSSRPRPDGQVEEAAERIGAVHALTADLYQQWTLGKTGKLDKDAVVRSLMLAEPGVWVPPTPAEPEPDAGA